MSNLLTEESLWLSGLRRGDQKVFESLFKRYYTMLCAYASKFVSREDGQEIVNDLFVRIWENHETLLIDTSLNAYLFKAVYCRCLNKLAQEEALQRAHLGFYEEMQNLFQDTDPCQVKELAARIKEAVEELPDSYREAFVMHRFQNMTYKDIAERLDVSSKTVDYRIQQALKLLRVSLKDYLPLLLVFIENNRT